MPNLLLNYYDLLLLFVFIDFNKKFPTSTLYISIIGLVDIVVVLIVVYYKESNVQIAHFLLSADKQDVDWFQEMHEQMSGYKRMRREHQAALLKLEERCKADVDAHKAQLDREYEALLQQLSRELERLQVPAPNSLNNTTAGIAERL